MYFPLGSNGCSSVQTNCRLVTKWLGKLRCLFWIGDGIELEFYLKILTVSSKFHSVVVWVKLFSPRVGVKVVNRTNYCLFCVQEECDVSDHWIWIRCSRSRVFVWWNKRKFCSIGSTQWRDWFFVSNDLTRICVWMIRERSFSGLSKGEEGRLSEADNSYCACWSQNARSSWILILCEKEELIESVLISSYRIEILLETRMWEC